jgi:1-acyl-sn-glycerol-3-phosphate acyltransferase
MADLKPQVYKDPRPAEHFMQFHERARKGIGWTYRAVRIILTIPTIVIYRCRAVGKENIPTSGPAIVTPNHFSQMDHFFAAVHMRRRVQFMAKSQLFTNPILTYVFTHGGVFPVRRGHSDKEAFKTGHTILGRDGLVLMYAEGGRSRSGGLGQPKRGVGKLALEAGVPVVPVAIHGSAAVRRWKKLRFPKVTVQYGEPIPFDRVENPTREQQQAAADKVFAEVRRMYTALEEKGRRGVIKDLKAAKKAPALDAGVRRYSS